MKNIFKNENATSKLAATLLCVLSILGIILFYLTQYVIPNVLLSYLSHVNVSGHHLAFDTYNGFILFFFTVVFCLIIIVCALTIIIDKLKAFRRIIFIACATLSLLSILVYVITHFHIMNRYDFDYDFVRWSLPFWFAIIVHCISLFVSLTYLKYVNKNKKTIA